MWCSVRHLYVCFRAHAINQVPGVRLPETLRLDAMHVIDLGLNLRWQGMAIRRMLETKLYEGDTWAHKVQSFVRQLRIARATPFAFAFVSANNWPKLIG